MKRVIGWCLMAIVAGAAIGVSGALFVNSLDQPAAVMPQPRVADVVESPSECCGSGLAPHVQMRVSDDGLADGVASRRGMIEMPRGEMPRGAFSEWPRSTDSRDYEEVPAPVLEPLPELPPPSVESGGRDDASFLPDSVFMEEFDSMSVRRVGRRVSAPCVPRVDRACLAPSPPTPLPHEARGRGETVLVSARPQSPSVETGLAGGDISLRVAFETFLLPSLDRSRASKTTSSYFTSLGHWEAFHRLRGSTNSTPALEVGENGYLDPPIYQISDEMLNEFGEWLMVETCPSPPAPLPEAGRGETVSDGGGAGLSVATADKVWKNLRAILRRVGPRESRNPKAVGILDRVPTMDPVSDLADPDRLTIGEGAVDVTDDELGAIYEACEIATWPGECSVMQWRTYLVILAVMGPRVNDAATLTVEHFRMEAKSPVRRSTREHEQGWLVYLPTKTKGKKRTRLIVPLPPCVRDHVESLLRQRGGRLFSWVDSGGHRFAEQWQRIVDQAGLPHVQRRHMRAMANLRWSRTGVRDDLGKWVLGHAARDVNESNYTRIEPDLIAAVPRLEIPVAFASRLSEGPVQTFLF